MVRLILIAFLIFSSFSYSQDWVLLDENDKGEQIYIRDHADYTAWIKRTNQKFLRDGSSQSDSLEGYTVSLLRFDCDLKKLGLVVYIEYTDSGAVLGREEFKEYEIEMNYASPDSMGEYLINAFCESKE